MNVKHCTKEQLHTMGSGLRVVSNGGGGGGYFSRRKGGVAGILMLQNQWGMHAGSRYSTDVAVGE